MYIAGRTAWVRQRCRVPALAEQLANSLLQIPTADASLGLGFRKGESVSDRPVSSRQGFWCRPDAEGPRAIREEPITRKEIDDHALALPHDVRVAACVVRYGSFSAPGHERAFRLLETGLGEAGRGPPPQASDRERFASELEPPFARCRARQHLSQLSHRVADDFRNAPDLCLLELLLVATLESRQLVARNESPRLAFEYPESLADVSRRAVAGEGNVTAGNSSQLESPPRGGLEKLGKRRTVARRAGNVQTVRAQEIETTRGGLFTFHRAQVAKGGATISVDGQETVRQPAWTERRKLDGPRSLPQDQRAGKTPTRNLRREPLDVLMHVNGSTRHTGAHISRHQSTRLATSTTVRVSSNHCRNSLRFIVGLFKYLQNGHGRALPSAPTVPAGGSPSRKS